MNNQEYFLNTSLSYQLQAARRELADFRSGEIFQKLRRDYEGIIRSQKREIEKLRRERDELSFTRKGITRQWTEVLDDMAREYEKEVKKLKKTIAELMDIIASLTNRNTELEGQKKELLHKYYETASQLEEAQGMIVKLQAQVNHNYENSSLPSSKCIDRKKITNNREKTGRKPGAQPGHKHHPRRKLTPSRTVEILPDKKYLDESRYIPTGKSITKQVAGVSVRAVVTQYSTQEFYDRKTGHMVHSPFPAGVVDDVNYDESLKAFAFLLNNRCNVPLEKTTEFISEMTGGELRPSVGMINGLCHEFSGKSREEQDQLFKALLDAPVMNADGTTVRINGKNSQVFVCCNQDTAMYFARESKGHEGVRGTPVESYGGILIHDHDKTYYRYGSDHQECMVHILRYLKGSMENEPDRTWNREMHGLIQEMIHAVNLSRDGVLTQEERSAYSERYDEIVKKSGKEKEQPFFSQHTI
ncbi:MAG: transposase [Lachnospiraceae bacterium]|nr:transposase [Lachnospiraceae bacterium]